MNELGVSLRIKAWACVRRVVALAGAEEIGCVRKRRGEARTGGGRRALYPWESEPTDLGVP